MRCCGLFIKAPSQTRWQPYCLVSIQSDLPDLPCRRPSQSNVLAFYLSRLPACGSGPTFQYSFSVFLHYNLQFSAFQKVIFPCLQSTCACWVAYISSSVFPLYTPSTHQLPVYPQVATMSSSTKYEPYTLANMH